MENKIKDEIMNNILSKRSNQRCFDCGSHSPNWSSPYLGIVICMECAGRHRGYGTHISFVKSLYLDKWNKKQLKTLELTGNLYMKKRFEKLGVPKLDSIYDYNSDLILDIRKELEKLVKENLKPDDYTHLNKNNSENNKINDEEENLINNNIVNNVETEKILKPVKFEMKNESSGNEKVTKKVNKKNKIKKIDIDFNFDDYKETSNTKSTKEEEKEEFIDTKKISGMKLSKKDKKKMAIEEKNKKNNLDKNKKKTCCEKFKEYIYYIFSLFNNKK